MKLLVSDSVYHVSNQADLDKLYTMENEKPGILMLNLSSLLTLDLSHIPPFIHTLHFARNANKYISQIPPTITTLHFLSFSCKLEDLPPTIQDVRIREGFNHPVDNLGNHFMTLDFGIHFNQPVSNLPSSLISVYFRESFTQTIDNLPHNLKFLHILNPNYDYSQIYNLPSSLILLQIKGKNIGYELEIEIGDLGKKQWIVTTMCIQSGIAEPNIKNIYFY